MTGQGSQVTPRKHSLSLLLRFERFPETIKHGSLHICENAILYFKELHIVCVRNKKKPVFKKYTVCLSAFWYESYLIIFSSYFFTIISSQRTIDKNIPCFFLFCYYFSAYIPYDFFEIVMRMSFLKNRNIKKRTPFWSSKKRIVDFSHSFFSCE